MTQGSFRKSFKALLASFAAVCVLWAAPAQANGGWGTLQLIDMTTATQVSGDMVITTGFIDNLNVVAFEQPTLSVAPDGFLIETIEAPVQSGWSGLVEVDIKEDPTLPLDQVSAFSDTFAQTDRETQMSGFYTMRYQFETDQPFKPYAGWGIGLVAEAGPTDRSGVIAGRATAGFDLSVGESSAIYAEYAYVKSGGVTIGEAAGLPTDEHSVKFGFRRTF